MTTTAPQAALLSVHWYSIDKHGAATLCVDEDDAKATAIDSQTLYPHNGPYRAVQMAPIEPAQAGELPDPDAVFYCSEDTGYLTQYRNPPANLTDGDVAMYEADTVRSLISAALAARKPLTPTDEQVTAAARAMCDEFAADCNVDRDDAWMIHCEEFKDSARRALISAFGINSLEVKP